MLDIKDKVNKILACKDCYGQGVQGWVSADGDYDFEYCDCNPDEIILDNGKVVE